MGRPPQSATREILNPGACTWSEWNKHHLYQSFSLPLWRSQLAHPTVFHHRYLSHRFERHAICAITIWWQQHAPTSARSHKYRLRPLPTVGSSCASYRARERKKNTNICSHAETVIYNPFTIQMQVHSQDRHRAQKKKKNVWPEGNSCISKKKKNDIFLTAVWNMWLINIYEHKFEHVCTFLLQNQISLKHKRDALSLPTPPGQIKTSLWFDLTDSSITISLKLCRLHLCVCDSKTICSRS